MATQVTTSQSHWKEPPIITPQTCIQPHLAHEATTITTTPFLMDLIWPSMMTTTNGANLHHQDPRPPSQQPHSMTPAAQDQVHPCNLCTRPEQLILLPLNQLPPKNDNLPTIHMLTLPYPNGPTNCTTLDPLAILLVQCHQEFSDSVKRILAQHNNLIATVTKLMTDLTRICNTLPTLQIKRMLPHAPLHPLALCKMPCITNPQPIASNTRTTYLEIYPSL